MHETKSSSSDEGQTQWVIDDVLYISESNVLYIIFTFNTARINRKFTKDV